MLEPKYYHTSAVPRCAQPLAPFDCECIATKRKKITLFIMPTLRQQKSEAAFRGCPSWNVVVGGKSHSNWANTWATTYWYVNKCTEKVGCTVLRSNELRSAKKITCQFQMAWDLDLWKLQQWAAFIQRCRARKAVEHTRLNRDNQEIPLMTKNSREEMNWLWPISWRSGK